MCVRQPGRLRRRRRICCRRVCGQGGGEGRLTGGKKLDNDVELLVSASGMCAAKTGFSTLACRGRRVLPAGSTASGTRNCLCASAATLGPPNYFDDATGTPAKNRGVGRAAAPDQPAHAGRGGGYRTACQQADPAYRSGRVIVSVLTSRPTEQTESTAQSPDMPATEPPLRGRVLLIEDRAVNQAGDAAKKIAAALENGDLVALGRAAHALRSGLLYGGADRGGCLANSQAPRPGRCNNLSQPSKPEDTHHGRHCNWLARRMRRTGA